jgi:putative transposase
LRHGLWVLKTNSSRWVHEKWPFRATFGWQTGYGAFSVSQSNISSVLRYIANQEEHHRKVSFQEEFIAYLRKHGIEYDERYIWQ